MAMVFETQARSLPRRQSAFKGVMVARRHSTHPLKNRGMMVSVFNSIS